MFKDVLSKNIEHQTNVQHKIGTISKIMTPDLGVPYVHRNLG